jgi:hypothetical protein
MAAESEHATRAGAPPIEREAAFGRSRLREILSKCRISENESGVDESDHETRFDAERFEGLEASGCWRDLPDQTGVFP